MKNSKYVIIIEGHGEIVTDTDISTLEKAKEVARILGGKVGIR